ncbi:hypothetical protein BOTBODRAFT_183020 [Botryobasidium botryosum FD-172 SS1]|uniref:Xylanolytic transcriptional activator regulatory domain-containing protein n=1 Tax=Botryobasidium botryosum (strain FD-172 SS1) TaxID=930990 RepID=A0A067N475_BOTB1|nr:hypothetical protein BOTBODRAFT_183020 [Botryobasidium botryosum FD-172 SS1]
MTRSPGFPTSDSCSGALPSTTESTVDATLNGRTGCGGFVSPNSSDDVDVLPSVAITPEVLHLIDIFYIIPQTFLPLLPPRQTLNLHTMPPLLLNAILALATRYSARKISVDYRSAARALLTAQPAWLLASPIPPSGRQTQRLQAMLALTYLEFGVGNIEESRELLRKAVELAVSWSWNIMDAPILRSLAGQPIHQGGILSGTGTSKGSAELGMEAEQKRRVWWEIWATDIMLEIASGLPRVLENIPCHINKPVANPQNAEYKFYSLRIKSLSLLREASDFPPCTSAAVRLENTDRLRCLDAMIDNAFMQSHGAWIDASSECSQDECRRDAVINRNMFFMNMVMLNAASVHLHRRYALPELNFSVGSCALGSPPPYTLSSFHQNNPDPLPLPAKSIAKIISQSRLIMSLFRHSHQSSITRARPVLKKDYLDEDIVRHSPFCSCAQATAAFGSAIEVATASSKWQAMAAKSNIDAVQHVLSRLKRVWPVAARFEEELAQCQQAVESTLRLW